MYMNRVNKFNIKKIWIYAKILACKERLCYNFLNASYLKKFLASERLYIVVYWEARWGNWHYIIISSSKIQVWSFGTSRFYEIINFSFVGLVESKTHKSTRWKTVQGIWNIIYLVWNKFRSAFKLHKND